MIHRSYETEQTEWTELFHACRTAVKAQGSLRLTEFLLPALIAFQICHGNGRDRDLFLQEIEGALGKTMTNHIMPLAELRKAISTVFMVLETLHAWVEVDKKTAKKRQKADSKQNSRKDEERKKWLYLDPSKRIMDTISKVSFQTRARAAASVNLHACALRFFELAARETVVKTVYGPRDGATNERLCSTKSRASGQPLEVHELKSTLMALGDYETMSSLDEVAFMKNSPERTYDQIREKEGLRDWQGALHDYERSIQQYPNEAALRTGTLRCLLELGHYESLLQQAKALSLTEARPLAVEASCRLGRWESIDELVTTGANVSLDDFGSEGQYQFAMGKLMSSLHHKKQNCVTSSIREARNAVMESLSSTARENYGRAYKDIVRLQILREMEDASRVLCSQKPSCFVDRTNDSSWGWNRRLEMLSLGGSSEVIKSRIALARLVGDRELEAGLFVKLGSVGRKLNSTSIATSSLSHAESLLCGLDGPKATDLKGSLRLETAKLRHVNEESTVALRILGNDELTSSMDLSAFRQQATRQTISNDGQENLMAQVRCDLKATRWIIEGGLKGCDEIISRFDKITQTAPKFEKGILLCGICSVSDL